MIAIPFHGMMPKPQEAGETFIKNNLFNEFEQLNENGSLISEYDGFVKYNDTDGDRDRATSIISLTSAYSLSPSNNNSAQLSNVNSKSPPRTPLINIKEHEKLSSRSIDNEEKSKNKLNLEAPLDHLSKQTEPQTLVESFLSLFNSPVKEKANIKETDSNAKTELDNESITDDYQVKKNNRRLSWSHEIPRKNNNEDGTDNANDRHNSISSDTDNINGRRYSISSNATNENERDDETFVSYYSFQSNVVKAFLYEV